MTEELKSTSSSESGSPMSESCEGDECDSGSQFTSSLSFRDSGPSYTCYSEVYSADDGFELLIKKLTLV
jgi:hypothetical protein